MSAESLQTSISPVGSLIGPVMDVSMARERLMQFQQFVKEYLVENEDFGIIPGTPKPTLLKPGADKLCELYGLADDYEVTQRTEDFEKGLFDYEVKCVLMSKAGGFLVSTGLGSCNSYEKKYRWRDAQRQCPNCGKETIIKGKEEYGGGWLCYAKKGGCGAKFADNDPQITSQTVGKVQNEDVADLKNTILKMAKKRAKIDATLSATRSSGVFTQDIEDWDIPKSGRALDPTSENLSKPAGAPTAIPPTQSPTDQQAASPDSTVSQQPALQEKFLLDGDLLTCVIRSVTEMKTKTKNTPYLKLIFNGYVACEGGSNNYAFCYDFPLFDALKAADKKECQLRLDTKTKFIKILDVFLVDGVEYINGKPSVDTATGEVLSERTSQ